MFLRPSEKMQDATDTAERNNETANQKEKDFKRARVKEVEDNEKKGAVIGAE